jgi:prefoldin subunit 1
LIRPDFQLRRFVATPIPAIDKRLTTEHQTLKTDIDGLEKRLHYLETTHKNSVDNIEQILNRARV